ncbi:MAG TPA: NUDIX hydrolase [Mycobacteriales bacterium]|nr:NUDIX hydrolase [Mycobacteriales bacterium]
MELDNWVRCGCGRTHWGRHGAAGLLVRAPGPCVLLQHRAVWSHNGGTWGVPGGALAAGETAEQGALRETVEETGMDVSQVTVVGSHLDDHGDWSYTTLLATAPERLAVQPERESLELRWVDVDAVTQLPLHPGFAASWALLSARVG